MAEEKLSEEALLAIIRAYKVKRKLDNLGDETDSFMSYMKKEHNDLFKILKSEGKELSNVVLKELGGIAGGFLEFFI
jgi:hypothetical protein